MIQSQYILDIFDLAFDDHVSSDLLRQQVQFLSLAYEEHTGVGLFVHFTADSRIEQYRLNTSNSVNFDIQGNPTERIDGVEIRNPELHILADATVHLKN